MSAAPDHTPTFAALSLSDRLEKAAPFLLVPVLVVLGFFAIGTTSSWLTLTVSGLAMGMMIFIMASGLTLVFGLMDVINFGHGAFISVGAYVGISVLLALSGWTGAPSLVLNILAVLLAAPAHLAAGSARTLVLWGPAPGDAPRLCGLPGSVAPIVSLAPSSVARSELDGTLASIERFARAQPAPAGE